MAMRTAEKVEKLKAWCVKNYEKGADTMVECWDDQQYMELLAEFNGNFNKARSQLKRLAGIYAERQADARNSIF